MLCLPSLDPRTNATIIIAENQTSEDSKKCGRIRKNTGKWQVTKVSQKGLAGVVHKPTHIVAWGINMYIQVRDCLGKFFFR